MLGERRQHARSLEDAVRRNVLGDEDVEVEVHRCALERPVADHLQRLVDHQALVAVDRVERPQAFLLEVSEGVGGLLAGATTGRHD